MTSVRNIMKIRPSTLALLLNLAIGKINDVAADIALEHHVAGLTFPVEIATDPNAAEDRLYIVEQGGLIKVVVREANQPAYILSEPFLDISSKVSFTGAEFEEGLLGLAFHPTKPGYFFINYTKRGTNKGQGEGANKIRTVVSRLKVNNDGLADPTSEVTILEIDQPKIYHNGGTLVFGPNDKYLYIASGDGGGAGDPGNNAQNLGTRLGKILRIDVDNVESPPFSFEIPQSNPFVGTDGALEEIWAYGLRNPWKIRFDRDNGDLYIGDVGQSRTEEINYQAEDSPGGENYGWDMVQGDECNRLGQDCDLSLYVSPVLTYPNFGGDCSVTGGQVYRGQDINGLYGTYLYADFCSGKIWAATEDGPGTWTSTLLLQAPFLVPTFGEDSVGELYVADYYGGAIHKIIQG